MFPSSINLIRLRFAALGPTGVPSTLAEDILLTDAVGQLTITPRVQAGRRVAFTRAGGDVGPILNAPSRLIGADLILALCAPDPQIVEMLVGGTRIDSGSDPVFYAPPAEGMVGDENGVSAEAFSLAADGDELTGDYLQWVLPKTHWINGPTDLRYGPLDVVLTGYAERGAFGFGPGGDWPYPSTEPWQYALVSDLPCLGEYEDTYDDVYGCVA